MNTQKLFTRLYVGSEFCIDTLFDSISFKKHHNVNDRVLAPTIVNSFLALLVCRCEEFALAGKIVEWEAIEMGNVSSILNFPAHIDRKTDYVCILLNEIADLVFYPGCESCDVKSLRVQSKILVASNVIVTLLKHARDVFMNSNGTLLLYAFEMLNCIVGSLLNVSAGSLLDINNVSHETLLSELDGLLLSSLTTILMYIISNHLTVTRLSWMNLCGSIIKVEAAHKARVTVGICDFSCDKLNGARNFVEEQHIFLNEVKEEWQAIVKSSDDCSGSSSSSVRNASDISLFDILLKVLRRVYILKNAPSDAQQKENVESQDSSNVPVHDLNILAISSVCFGVLQPLASSVGLSFECHIPQIVVLQYDIFIRSLSAYDSLTGYVNYAVPCNSYDCFMDVQGCVTSNDFLQLKYDVEQMILALFAVWGDMTPLVCDAGIGEGRDVRRVADAGCNGENRCSPSFCSAEVCMLVLRQTEKWYEDIEQMLAAQSACYLNIAPFDLWLLDAIQHVDTYHNMQVVSLMLCFVCCRVAANGWSGSTSTGSKLDRTSTSDIDKLLYWFTSKFSHSPILVCELLDAAMNWVDKCGDCPGDKPLISAFSVLTSCADSLFALFKQDDESKKLPIFKAKPDVDIKVHSLFTEMRKKILINGSPSFNNAHSFDKSAAATFNSIPKIRSIDQVEHMKGLKATETNFDVYIIRHREKYIEDLKEKILRCVLLAAPAYTKVDSSETVSCGLTVLESQMMVLLLQGLMRVVNYDASMYGASNESSDFAWYSDKNRTVVENRAVMILGRIKAEIGADNNMSFSVFEEEFRNVLEFVKEFFVDARAHAKYSNYVNYSTIDSMIIAHHSYLWKNMVNRIIYARPCLCLAIIDVEIPLKVILESRSNVPILSCAELLQLNSEELVTNQVVVMRELAPIVADVSQLYIDKLLSVESKWAHSCSNTVSDYGARSLAVTLILASKVSFSRCRELILSASRSTLPEEGTTLDATGATQVYCCFDDSYHSTLSTICHHHSHIIVTTLVVKFIITHLSVLLSFGMNMGTDGNESCNDDETIRSYIYVSSSFKLLSTIVNDNCQLQQIMSHIVLSKLQELNKFCLCVQHMCDLAASDLVSNRENGKYLMFKSPVNLIIISILVQISEICVKCDNADSVTLDKKIESAIVPLVPIYSMLSSVQCHLDRLRAAETYALFENDVIHVYQSSIEAVINVIANKLENCTDRVMGRQTITQGVVGSCPYTGANKATVDGAWRYSMLLKVSQSKGLMFSHHICKHTMDEVGGDSLGGSVKVHESTCNCYHLVNVSICCHTYSDYGSSFSYQLECQENLKEDCSGSEHQLNSISGVVQIDVDNFCHLCHYLPSNVILVPTFDQLTSCITEAVDSTGASLHRRCEIGQSPNSYYVPNSYSALLYTVYGVSCSGAGGPSRNGNVELPEICLLKMCWGGVFRCLRLCGASLDTSSSLPYMSFFTNLIMFVTKCFSQILHITGREKGALDMNVSSPLHAYLAVVRGLFPEQGDSRSMVSGIKHEEIFEAIRQSLNLVCFKHFHCKNDNSILHSCPHSLSQMKMNVLAGETECADPGGDAVKGADLTLSAWYCDYFQRSLDTILLIIDTCRVVYASCVTSATTGKKANESERTLFAVEAVLSTMRLSILSLMNQFNCVLTFLRNSVEQRKDGDQQWYAPIVLKAGNIFVGSLNVTSKWKLLITNAARKQNGSKSIIFPSMISSDLSHYLLLNCMTDSSDHHNEWKLLISRYAAIGGYMNEIYATGFDCNWSNGILALARYWLMMFVDKAISSTDSKEVAYSALDGIMLDKSLQMHTNNDIVNPRAEGYGESEKDILPRQVRLNRIATRRKYLLDTRHQHSQLEVATSHYTTGFPPSSPMSSSNKLKISSKLMEHDQTASESNFNYHSPAEGNVSVISPAGKKRAWGADEASADKLLHKESRAKDAVGIATGAAAADHLSVELLPFFATRECEVSQSPIELGIGLGDDIKQKIPTVDAGGGEINGDAAEETPLMESYFPSANHHTDISSPFFSGTAVALTNRFDREETVPNMVSPTPANQVLASQYSDKAKATLLSIIGNHSQTSQSTSEIKSAPGALGESSSGEDGIPDIMMKGSNGDKAHNSRNSCAVPSVCISGHDMDGPGVTSPPASGNVPSEQEEQLTAWKAIPQSTSLASDDAWTPTSDETNKFKFGMW